MRVTTGTTIGSCAALAGAIALAAGCGAPAAGLRAERPVIDETPIGDNAYILRRKLGGPRSQRTAFEPFYQRAGELCPGGFLVVDTADGSRSTYVRTIHGVQEIRRPDMAIVVQCHPPRTAD